MTHLDLYVAGEERRAIYGEIPTESQVVKM